MPNQAISVEPEGEAIGLVGNARVRGSKTTEIGDITP